MNFHWHCAIWCTFTIFYMPNQMQTNRLITTCGCVQATFFIGCITRRMFQINWNIRFAEFGCYFSFIFRLVDLVLLFRFLFATFFCLFVHIHRPEKNVFSLYLLITHMISFWLVCWAYNFLCIACNRSNFVEKTKAISIEVCECKRQKRFG